MSFTVTYDSNILYPASLRDLLVRLAATGLFEAKWTDRILDEMINAITYSQPGLQGKLIRTVRYMNEYLPNARVTSYENLIDNLQLPDPDDRHVLAAAIHSDSQILITRNLKDFPRGYLAEYYIDLQSPDEFILRVIEIDPNLVINVLREQASDLKNPPQTIEQLLDRLGSNFLPQVVALIKRFMA